MPTFNLGVASRAQLVGVNPKLVGLVERALQLSEIDFAVNDGVRTLEEQKELLKHGATTTLHSKHLPHPDGYGWAVDLVPWIGGKKVWSWPPIYKIASAMQQASREYDVEITWGGVWDRLMSELDRGPEALAKAVQGYEVRHPGKDFIDGPHFQLGRN